MHGAFDVSLLPSPSPQTPELSARPEPGDEESVRFTHTHAYRSPKAPSSVQLLTAHPDPQGPKAFQKRVFRHAEEKTLTYWKVDPSRVTGTANILSTWKSTEGLPGGAGVHPRSRPLAAPCRSGRSERPGPRAHVLGGRTRSARWSAELAGVSVTSRRLALGAAGEGKRAPPGRPRASRAPARPVLPAPRSPALCALLPSAGCRSRAGHRAADGRVQAGRALRAPGRACCAPGWGVLAAPAPTPRRCGLACPGRFPQSCSLRASPPPASCKQGVFPLARWGRRVQGRRRTEML